MSNDAHEFVSRGGLKLQAGLEAFELGAAGWVCADFGCNVGGFTDCLLRRGAVKVYAIDTGYGELAWTLRRDSRVVVMERTNALHCQPAEKVDLVVADVAWTPQSRIIPAAMAWLKPGGRIVSLLKPHYELTKIAGRKPVGVLDPGKAEEVCRDVCSRLADAGWCVRAVTRSAILGKGGNVEFLLLINAPASHPGESSVE